MINPNLAGLMRQIYGKITTSELSSRTYSAIRYLDQMPCCSNANIKENCCNSDCIVKEDNRSMCSVVFIRSLLAA